MRIAGIKPTQVLGDIEMEALYILKAGLDLIFNHMVSPTIKPSDQKMRDARYVFQGCKGVEMKDGSLGTRTLIDRFQFLKLGDHDRSCSMKSTKRYLQVLRRFSDLPLVCLLTQKRLSPYMCLVHDVECFTRNSYRISRNTKYSLVSLPILLLNALSFLLHKFVILLVLTFRNLGRVADCSNGKDCLGDSRPGLHGRRHFWRHVVIPLRVLETGF